jgi:hypothetical protein
MKDYEFNGKIYKISQNGIVYSPTGKIMALIDNGTGYLQVTLNSGNMRKKIYIHRLVWETFNGQIPTNLEVDHLDENKSNNNLSNLTLVTRKENMTKMLKSNPHILLNLKQY